MRVLEDILCERQPAGLKHRRASLRLARVRAQALKPPSITSSEPVT